MAWTEPTIAQAAILTDLLGHEGLLSYVDRYRGTQVGNKISVPVIERPTVSTVNVNAIPASSKNDTILTLTAVDYVARTALKPSEYRTMVNVPEMQEKLIKAHADAVRIQLETDLDVLLATSTNTKALGADNTFTLAKILESLAGILKNGYSLDQCIFLTGEAGWASIMEQGYANAGGKIAGIRNSVGTILDAQIPVVVSAQCTISAATGGAAGYLWAKEAVILAFGDIQHLTPPDEPNRLTQSHDTVTIAAADFEFKMGVAGGGVVKFTNP